MTCKKVCQSVNTKKEVAFHLCIHIPLATIHEHVENRSSPCAPNRATDNAAQADRFVQFANTGLTGLPNLTEVTVWVQK